MKFDPDLAFVVVLAVLLTVIIVALGYTPARPEPQPIEIHINLIATQAELDAMDLEVLYGGHKPIIRNVKRKP